MFNGVQSPALTTAGFCLSLSCYPRTITWIYLCSSPDQTEAPTASGSPEQGRWEPQPAPARRCGSAGLSVLPGGRCRSLSWRILQRTWWGWARASFIYLYFESPFCHSRVVICPILVLSQGHPGLHGTEVLLGFGLFWNRHPHIVRYLRWGGLPDLFHHL